MRRRLAGGAAANALGRAALLVITFLLTPYILGHVGPSGYGLWILVGSVVAYGDLLDLGIGSAVIKYVAEFRARGDPNSAKGLLATALWLYLALGLLMVLASIVLALVITDLIGIEPDQAPTARVLVILMGVNVGVTIAAAPAMSVLGGLQRFDLHNAVKTGGAIVWALGTVVVLDAGWGIVGMVALTIPVTLLSRVVSLRLIRRVAPDLPFGYSGASTAVARKILGFSVAVFATQLSRLLQNRSDEIIVGIYLTVAAVTPYALARRLSEVTHLLTAEVVRGALPAASELDAGSDTRRLQLLYVVGTRVTIAISLPLAAIVIMLGREILQAWVGPGYESAVPLIVILTIAAVLMTSQWPLGSILQGINRFRVMAAVSVTSGFANLILSIALVQQMGTIGVALGTLIPTVAVVILFCIPYGMWVLKVSLWRTIFEIWLPPSIAAVPMVVTIQVLREAAPPATLIVVALVAMAAGAVYVLAYLALPAARHERRLLLDALRHLRGLKRVRAQTDR
ncbi:oligosaccharide flippase family protein [soil metagenome]